MSFIIPSSLTPVFKEKGAVQKYQEIIAAAEGELDEKALEMVAGGMPLLLAAGVSGNGGLNGGGK